MKNIIYNIAGTIGTILLLNFLINLIFVSKNSGEKYVHEYINSCQEVRIKVNPNDKDFLEEKFKRESYFIGTFYFKGLFRGYAGEMIKDEYSGHFFRIVRFDAYGDKFSRPQTYKIENQELIVKVDPLQLNDKKFGTKQNPILVFWYKGANKELMTEMETGEREENGRSIYEHVLLSPTEKEYRYNVEQYLTYVMPKEEFKQRFKNK
ncbi:hypothetical protein [Bergeyella zoohelcum]|uniref:DUF8188 domain-containing protein n=1 Tax=Bergeyella zoohelcum TaxID=1015 RepID=A0A376C0X3_9FLAO|nr:hypothetical protein [Bergeyella zoohelcum]SSZ55750.1 Uncharacterised protein [Bergeyella zoohelcum]